MTTPTPMHDHDHDHDRGLAFDLPRLIDRRRALQVLGGAGLLALVGCASSNGNGAAGTAAATSGGSGTSGTSGTTATTAGASATTGSTAATTAAAETADVEVIPEETAGPYPADGSNGPNVLTESGVVRSDIRSSFGSSSGTAEGILTTIAFTVVDADGDVPLPGAAVYAWHCDREGRYSIYSEGAEDQNYLRGVQETAADGAATFTTIYPGCYSGRWPHVHFEVYASLADATSGAGPIATSQIALPEDVSGAVYATEGYEDSVANAAQVSLEGDNVFNDGWELETPTASGSIDEGYTIALTVGVAV
jgi:protocatechuate 3,4-dioxygenase beta subunit